MRSRDPGLAHLWYLALHSPCGIEIECLPDNEAVRQKMYAIRAELRDDDLKGISLVISPFDRTHGRLWLVKKEPCNETP